MKSLLAAAFALGLLAAAPTANAAPLTAAPAASLDLSDAGLSAEPVNFRHRRHYRHYGYVRPYYGFSYGYSRPWRECWWRHGRRVCVIRYY